VAQSCSCRPRALGLCPSLSSSASQTLSDLSVCFYPKTGKVCGYVYTYVYTYICVCVGCTHCNITSYIYTKLIHTHTHKRESVVFFLSGFCQYKSFVDTNFVATNLLGINLGQVRDAAYA
jgi:hypothetical protein